MSCTHCNEWFEGSGETSGTSRKRFRVEFRKLGTNITKRVLNEYFSKEGNADPSEDETDYIPLLCNKSNVDDLLSTHMGDRKLAPNKLP